MRAVLTLLALVVSACATTPRQPPPAPEFLLKLSPASLGREVSLNQRITMVRDGDRKSFDALLEVDASEVRVALIAMGQTLGTLTWDGAKFESRVSTHVPPVVTAERIITDVQLAWWPEEAVRAALPAGFSLTETPGQRVLLKDGQPFVTVTWTEGRARVVLTQHRYGYALEIDSAEAL